MTKTLLEKMGLPVVLYDLFTVEIQSNRADCKLVGRHVKMFLQHKNQYLGVASPKLDDRINEKKVSLKEVKSMVEQEINMLLTYSRRYGVVVFETPDVQDTAMAYRADKGSTIVLWEVLIPTDGTLDNQQKIQSVMEQLIHEKDTKAFYF